LECLKPGEKGQGSADGLLPRKASGLQKEVEIMADALLWLVSFGIILNAIDQNATPGRRAPYPLAPRKASGFQKEVERLWQTYCGGS